MLKNILEFKNNILFASPEYLYWRIIAFIAVISVVIFILRKLNSPELSYGSKKPLIGTVKFFGFFAVVMLAFSIIALARPYIENGAVVIRRGSVQIIFVVDNSGSMLVKDVGEFEGYKYARIDVASKEILQLYRKNILKEGDRVSVFTFGLSSRARVQLTTDLNRFVNEVSKISQPEYISSDASYWGSDLALVLEDVYRRLDRFDGAKSENKNWIPKTRSDRLVILFSDGDFDFINSPKDPEEQQSYLRRLTDVIKEFRKRGLGINTVGIGGQKEVLLDSILKDYVKGKDYDVKLEEELKDIKTRLRLEGLEFIARQTGGIIPVPVINNAGSSVTDELAKLIDSHRSTRVETAKEKGRVEFWQYALLVGLLFTAIGIIFY